MEPIEWLDGKIGIIDQSRLPHDEVHLDLACYEEVAEAIKTLRIRGAPLIGIAGAYGLALCAQTIEARSKPQLLKELRRIAEALASTRPTAVNLRWAIERMLATAEARKRHRRHQVSADRRSQGHSRGGEGSHPEALPVRR